MQFSGSVDDDLKRRLAQFTSICDEYGSEDGTKMAHFFHLLRPDRQAYEHFMKFINGFLTSATLNTNFENRYNSEAKRAPASRKLNAIRFGAYQNIECSDADASKEIVADLERLNNPAHDDDQNNHSLCVFSWYVVKGKEWALHAQFKSEVEYYFTADVEALIDAIHKYETHMHRSD